MFKANSETLDAIKIAFEEKEKQFHNVRILLSGMGWSGPKFSLGLDEKHEDDYEEVIDGITFIIEQDLAEMFDDITVAYQNGEFAVGITGEAQGC